MQYILLFLFLHILVYKSRQQVLGCLVEVTELLLWLVPLFGNSPVNTWTAQSIEDFKS